MSQLRFKLKLDKRLTLAQQRRRYRKLIKRYQKQIDYAKAQAAARLTA